MLWANLLLVEGSDSRRDDPMNAHIQRASDADGSSILQLVRDAGLLVDGLVEHLNTMLVVHG
jgi:hypothetical protein